MNNLSFYLLFLGGSIIVALIFSRGATLIKSPLIVGYIAAGAILGPSIIGFISFEQIKSLEIVNVVTLSLIGFGIGGELRWKEVKKLGKSIISILIFESLGAFFLVSITLSIWLKNIPIGIIYGALAAATAPAGTVDVIKQYKAKGPLTTTLYAVVGLDDIMALLIYALAMPVAFIFLVGTKSSADTSIFNALIHAGLKILVTLGIGAGGGFTLTIIAKKIHDRVVLLLLSLAVILLNCGIAEGLNLSPILLNMAMGIVAINYNKVISSRIFNALGNWSPPMYVWFFILVGARLNIHYMIKFGFLAIIYIFARTTGKWVGSFLGAKISNAPNSVKKYLGFGLFSQAGVAIGLALSASKALEQIGLHIYANQIISTITATTFIVMLIGPIFVKYALFKSGEAKG